MFKSKTQIRNVRIISVVAVSFGLIFLGTSASARLAVGNLVNKALTVVRPPAKPKPAPRKQPSSPTLPASLLKKLSPVSFSLLPQADEASVSTDKLHYEPGETVLISGAGFRPGERVTLQVRHHDQREEVGPGYDPWDVYADGDGRIKSSWLVNPQEQHGTWLEVRAKGADSGLFAMVFFTDPASADLDQCANGQPSAPVPCTLDAWQNGNVNQNQAHYGEGDSVPYRMKFDQLTIGASNTLTISYDTTKQGKHALDYLTDYDRTETVGNNPCSGVAGCTLASETTFPIPVDPRVTNGQNQVPGGGDDIVQIPGSFSMFGGTITAVSNYTVTGTYAGDSTTSVTITFTANVTNPVMAWGGHIATRLNWGLANSAINISGSPYHMRLEALNGSGGNQDRSLSASAVFFPVSLTIVKETNPDNAQVKTFNYTTTGNGLSPFSLTPPDGLTPDSRNFQLTDETARTVTESDPNAAVPKFTLTGLSCIQTDGGLGVGSVNTNLGTRTVSFTPKEGQSLTCTYVNTQVLGKIIVDKVTVPGGDTTSFDFTTTYGSPFSLTDGANPNDSGNIVPGTYQVTETANADYTTTSTCTSSIGDPADDPSAIHLDAGETVTCTFTNTKKPKLTVTKILVPSNDTGLFNLQIDGVTQAANVGDGGTTGAQFVTIGSHTVGETAGTGTSLSDYTTVIGGDCAANGSVTLAAGDNKTCTITNTRRPKLTVTKILIPSNDTGLFNLQIDGVTQAANVGDGGTTGAQFVTIGSHTVGETAGTNTSLGDYTTVIGGDCAANGSVSLAAGDSKTCTITNTRKPKLTVTKILIPSNDTGKFNLQIDGVTQAANVGDGGTTGAQFVTIGAHTVGETAGTGTSLTDYTTVIGGDCDAAGNVSLSAGDNKTCTITNTRRPKLTVTKILIPSNDTGKFNLQIDGVTQASDVGDGGTTGAQFVTIGSHTVGETAGTGTSLTDYTTVIGGDCAANGSVSLAAGDNKTCTITNTRKPKLTVTKILIPSNDTGKFNLQIDGVTQASDVGDGGTTGAQFVTIGSHTVGETAGTGTSLSDYTTVIGGDCAANGSVSLAAGESKTCTITNTRRPKLTVTKILIPSNDTGKFNLQIDGVTQAADVGDGGTTGAQFVTIGSHTVGETAGTGTSLGDYTTVIGGDCAANGSVSLAAGDNKTCTITNTRRPKLTVTKILVPSNDTGLFNLQIDGVTQAANVGDGGTTGAQFVTVGSHTVGETAGTNTSLGDYSTVIGGDCAANGSVSLAAGDNKTCTITNTRKPKLTVTKILIPSNDTGLFNLQIDGATQAANVGDGGTTGAQFVTVGAHTVGETAGTATSLANYTTVIGGDCDAAGNVTLAAGESKTCTITNTRKPKLTVTKILIPYNDTGKFNLQIDGVTQAANVGNGGTTGAQFVSIGSHTVVETAGTATSLDDYSTVIGGDCDAAGNVTLAAGESKTCTITNTRRPKLTVTKILVPSNDTGLFNLQIDGVTQASNVGNGGTTGAQFVTIGSHTVGETAGTATSLGDYTTVIGGDCAANGSVTLAAGQSKTCTITNTRKPRLTVTKILLPANDTGVFNLRIDAVTLAANVGNGGTTGPQFAGIGGHVVSETAGTATSLSDYVTVIGGHCAANGSVTLAAGDNKTCTITNTKKAMAGVVKTVNGQPPAVNQVFTFELRQGASTFSNGTTLESKTTDASGNINFTTKLIPGDTYQICEQVFPAWNTNLAGDGPLFVPNSMIPPALPNPNVINLTVCADFTAQPGQTRTFTVNNSPPPGGRALTIGFWKNWSSCTGGGQKPMLDLALGIASKTTTNPPGGLVVSAQNPGALWPNYAAMWYLVLKGNPMSTADLIKPAPDCTRAFNLLDKSTVDGRKKQASDPLFNMTAQLMAAQLNRFMGAGINGTTIMNIDRAVLLNGKYKFDGLTYSPKLTTADANTANCLGTQLDNYNNGRPVSLCP